MFVLASGWKFAALRPTPEPTPAGARAATPAPESPASPGVQPLEADRPFDEEDLPTTAEGLIETFLEREGDGLFEVDLQSVESSLSHGEWGMAYDTLAAAVADEPEAFSDGGRALLAAAHKALGRE